MPPAVEPAFAVGTRVVLASPLNPKHPHRGGAGVVEDAGEPTLVGATRGREGVLRTLHWVAFDKPTVGRDGKTYRHRFPCYGTELVEEKKRGK